MKHSSAKLKQMARIALKGKWGYAAAFSALTLLFTLGLTLITFLFGTPTSLIGSIISWTADIITSLIAGLFSAGATYFYLNISRGQKYRFGDLFAAFRMSPDRFLIVALITSGIPSILSLPAYLWTPTTEDALAYSLVSLLLTYAQLIISIIMSLFFALSTFLLLDYPEMGAIDSLRVSARLMKGNKGRYFYITLSFTGWVFLSLFTLGMALLWIEPYMNMTLTYFYEDVLNEWDKNQKQADAKQNVTADESAVPEENASTSTEEKLTTES